MILRYLQNTLFNNIGLRLLLNLAIFIDFSMRRPANHPSRQGVRFKANTPFNRFISYMKYIIACYFFEILYFSQFYIVFEIFVMIILKSEDKHLFDVPSRFKIYNWREKEIFRSIKVTEKTPILFSLHIHTSNATLHRLNRFFMKYRRCYPFIKYYIVVSQNVTGPFPDVDVIRSNCFPDQVNGSHGLVCRDVASYKHFINHPEEGNWLFRAMDDTIVNIDNLIKLILKLNQFYDPERHVVFRGCQNFIRPKTWFLGGGSGWLSSRAMIELHENTDYSFLKYFEASYHKQDDTTETIIIQKVFNDFDQWNDPRWIEHCCNCDGFKFSHNDFSSIGECPLNDVYQLKETVSFHPHHKKKNEEMIEQFEFMPDNLYYYKSHRTDCSRLCFVNKSYNVGNRTRDSFMKEHAHPFTVDDVINGRNRINMNDPYHRIYLERIRINEKILERVENELNRPANIRNYL